MGGLGFGTLVEIGRRIANTVAVANHGVTSLAAAPRTDCALQLDIGAFRRNEPVTFGVPLPRGWCAAVERLRLRSDPAVDVPLQAQALERWPDGSIRWALLDFQASRGRGAAAAYTLAVAPNPSPAATGITVGQADGSIAIDTGVATFVLTAAGELLANSPGGNAPLASCRLRILDEQGQEVASNSVRMTREVDGPLRAVVFVESIGKVGQRSVVSMVRYHFHAGLSAVRVQATLRNPNRAAHPGGFWELGDAGSQFIRDCSFIVSTAHGGDASSITYSTEPGASPQSCEKALLLTQESSGGENWQSPNHLNRHRVVPLRYRGYRLDADSEQRAGLRATPIAVIRGDGWCIGLAQRRFWQRFPKVLAADARSLRLGLLPQEFGDLHEILGGEQVTEEFVVSFQDDHVSEFPLEWVREPMRIRATTAWYCDAEVVPHLTPAATDSHREYESLVNAAIDGSDTFEAKRERIDEYGWRHFGDLYADHEAVMHTGPGMFISHYNNQYDAVAGLAVQFFRSGDWRWFELFDDLARHVVDIDIYHTNEDKAAYSGGLFWHTTHHVNADLSAHRTYPRTSGASGGPSPEHNYNTGLMLYYLTTGDVRAREAVISLARWVINMDDGARTPLKWVSRARTGLPSATGSPRYHGPGRAPGNSIVALLNGFRLTGEEAYLAKAEELIRRCVHPHEDLDALNLLDAERRWFYTVFLQALGRYLHFKSEHGMVDYMHAYARTALLRYARWMAENEYPYLEKPEILEFPTETWAAQDMRKSEVFNFAAAQAHDASEAALFRERSRFFYEYSTSKLLAMPTRTMTRPLVLMLTNGYMQASFERHATPPAQTVTQQREFTPRPRFVRQRDAALRNMVIVGAIGAAAIVTLLLSLVWSRP